MAVLIVGDTHFTNKPQDSYRFRLFEWIHQLIAKNLLSDVCFLGDITDDKDRHPSELVHHLFESFAELGGALMGNLVLLMGNHDYINPLYPYCGVLDYTDRVLFVKDPSIHNVGEYGSDKAYCIPHGATLREEFKDIFAQQNLDLVLLHHTFTGAVTSSGYTMTGLEVPTVNAGGPDVFSGDIHKPQAVGPVQYVGTPYPVRFDDDFSHRAILWYQRGEWESITVPTIRKATVYLNTPEELRSAGFQQDDQVKVRLRVSPGEAATSTGTCAAIKEIAAELGVHLGGIELVASQQSPKRSSLHSHTPADIVKEHGASLSLDEPMIAAGLSCVS